MTISSAPGRYPKLAGTEPAGTEPAELTDEELHSFVVSPLAACADSALDPDDWFPIATAAARARAEASSALAVCAACPVRAECLELSLRQWRGVGRHGIWGGLVETDRNALRREWLKGVPVTALLSGPAHRPPAEAAEATCRAIPATADRLKRKESWRRHGDFRGLPGTAPGAPRDRLRPGSRIVRSRA